MRLLVSILIGRKQRPHSVHSDQNVENIKGAQMVSHDTRAASSQRPKGDSVPMTSDMQYSQTTSSPSQIRRPTCPGSTGRIEFKYLLPAVIRARFVNDLCIFCKQDDHSSVNHNGYLVRSIYYDNPELKCYHDKMAGTVERFKMRLRIYGKSHDTNSGKIELKYRFADRIVKQSLSLPWDQITRLMTGSLTQVDPQSNAIYGELVRLTKINRFRPVVWLQYARAAWFSLSDPSVRITIDSDVRGTRFRSFNQVTTPNRVFPASQHILEVKSPGHFPSWLTKLIKRYNLQREAISKYACAIESLAITHNVG